MTGGETIYSVYASGALIHTDNRTTGVATDYIAGPLGMAARVKRTNGLPGTDEVTFLHNDHLGSASSATDVTRTELWTESYTPYGESLINASANDNQPGFTGHIKDKATGLNYMQARYFDPVGGRFLSTDPVGFAAGGPGYFNRYAYTFNDPINGIDPTGMSVCAATRLGKDGNGSAGNCLSTGSGGIGGGAGSSAENAYNAQVTDASSSSSDGSDANDATVQFAQAGDDDSNNYSLYPKPGASSGLSQNEIDKLDPKGLNQHPGTLAGLKLMEEQIGETMNLILNNDAKGHPYQNFPNVFSNAQLPTGGGISYTSYKVGLRDTRGSANNSPVRIVTGRSPNGTTRYYLTVTHYYQFSVIEPHWSVIK